MKVDIRVEIVQVIYGCKENYYYQINNGYVVLCVARPKTDCEIEIGVESHDKLYRNPFLDPLAPHELKADIATQKNIKKNK